MCTQVVCSKDTVHQFRQYAKHLHTLAKLYKELTESYVVEFFVKNHWDLLPNSWQAALKDLSPGEVAHLLVDNTSPSGFPSVWPLSLLAYRAATHSLALDSTLVEDICSDTPTDLTTKPIDLLCRLHVKAKKRHEILRMAKVINSACLVTNAGRVVDVGSGHGHLSRLLSFGYGLYVTSIEAVGCHLTGAAKVDMKIKTIMQKRISRQSDLSPDVVPHTPRHVECTVHPQISVEEFLSVINSQSTLTAGAVNQSTQEQKGKVLHPGAGQSNCISLSEKHLASKRDSDALTKTSSFNAKQKFSKVNDDSPSSIHNPESWNDEINLQLNTSCFSETEIKNMSTNKPPMTGLFVLAGLHTCGDLAPTMLRVFSECQQARALVSVACCYMKMESALPSAHIDTSSRGTSLDDISSTSRESGSGVCQQLDDILENTRASGYDSAHCETEQLESDPEGGFTECEGTVRARGYPMSEWMQGLGENEIQFEALELACHSLKSYHQRLRDDGPSLILHGYRATVETLIQASRPELTQSHQGICKIKKAIASIRKPHLKSFEEYASAALGELNLPFEERHLTEQQERFQGQWSNVVTFHVLRCMMGPIIESLVLLDRVLFLYEQGIDSKLVPIFDSTKSPRNFALIAVKDSHR